MSKFRITRICMENIKGLKVGSQIVNFDISIGDTNLIAIQGENGSGKSSIMKNICLNNKGYTNIIPVDTVTGGFIKITYTNGTNTFELEHLYIPNKKVMKYMTILSTISDKGEKKVITNDSIKSAKQAVSTIFNIDYKNLCLMYISEMDKNILDLNSVDRKAFFYNNIKHIDEYQKHYYNVSEKAKMLKRNISSLEIRKNNYNMVNLNIEKENLEHFNLSLIRQMNDNISEKADLRNKKLNIRDNMTDNIYKEAKENVEVLEKLKSFIGEYNILEDDTFGSLNDIGRYYLERIDSYEDMVREHKKGIDSLELEKQSLINRKYNSEENIKILSQGEDRSYDEELANAKKELSSIIVHPIEYPDLDNKSINEMKFDLIKLHELIGRYGYDNTGYGDTLNNYMSDEQTHRGIVERTSHLKREVSSYERKVYDISNEINKIEETIGNQRPSDCTFTNCGLANAHLSRLEELKKTRESNSHDIDIMNKEIEMNSDRYGVFFHITQEDIFGFKEMNNMLNLINSKYNSIKLVNEFIGDRSRLMGGEYPFDILTKLSNIEANYFNIEKKKRFTALVKELDEKVRTPTSLSIIKAKTDIMEIDEKLIVISEKLEIIDKDYKVDAKIAKSFKKKHNEFIDKFNTYGLQTVTSTHLSVVEESIYRSKKIIEKFKDTSGNIHDINMNIKTLEEKYEQLKLESKNTSKKLMDIEFDIRTKTNLEKEHDDMFKKLEVVSLIRSSLSPKEGIPLYLITKYAYKLKELVNILLDNADSDYKIYDFIINEKEFVIMVIENGNIRRTEDLSGGERSIISLAISISLNRLFNPDIGFLMLDELDATLSSSFREIFNKIIESCDYQIFMISHNDNQNNIDHKKKVIKIDKYNKTIKLI